MQEDHGPAAVEFREDRVEALVAEVDTVRVRQQGHAVGVEFVEGESDLLQRAVHVRQGQRHEVAEAAGVVSGQCGGVLVDLPGEETGRLVVTEVHAG